MNDSVSATPPPKLDIKPDNVYTTDGTNSHLRPVTIAGSSTTMANAPRLTPDARLFSSPIIRTASMDNTNNPGKSMQATNHLTNNYIEQDFFCVFRTIVVQNPFEDSVRHVEDVCE